MFRFFPSMFVDDHTQVSVSGVPRVLRRMGVANFFADDCLLELDDATALRQAKSRVQLLQRSTVRVTESPSAAGENYRQPDGKDEINNG